MKVAITCIRRIKKPVEFKHTENFVAEMQKAGMPDCMCDELMQEGRAMWVEDKLDSENYYVAQIIYSDLEN